MTKERGKTNYQILKQLLENHPADRALTRYHQEKQTAMELARARECRGRTELGQRAQRRRLGCGCWHEGRRDAPDVHPAVRGPGQNLRYVCIPRSQKSFDKLLHALEIGVHTLQPYL